MAMENPLEPTSDIGAPSFWMQTIQRLFEVAFKLLLCRVMEPLVPCVSILAAILPTIKEMSKQTQVSNPKQALLNQAPLLTSRLKLGEPDRKRQRRR